MYKKTEIVKKIIENLKEGNQLNAAIYKAGAKPGTVWLWRKANPRLEKLIQAALNKCNNKRDEMVVDSLFKQALAGNPTCIAIYLKFKMGWKDSPLVDQSNHSHLEITWAKNGKEVDKDRLLTALSPIRHTRTPGEVQGGGNGKKVGKDDAGDKPSDTGGGV